jgi:hypothetical protein
MSNTFKNKPDFSALARQLNIATEEAVPRVTRLLLRDTKANVRRRGLVRTGTGLRAIAERIDKKRLEGYVVIRPQGAHLNLYNNKGINAIQVRRSAWHKESPETPRRRELKGFAEYQLEQRPFTKAETASEFMRQEQERIENQLKNLPTE